MKSVWMFLNNDFVVKNVENLYHAYSSSINRKKIIYVVKDNPTK